MHQNAIHDHFQLVRLLKQFGQLGPSLLLRAYDKSNPFYKAEQITIVPSDSILVYRLQIHDPSPQTNPIFLIGHAYMRYFQMSILLVQLDERSLHFQQVNQMHPNPLVVIPFHLLNDKNG